MGVRRTGDWDKARAKLTTGMGPRLATALRQATIRNALFLVREIQRGIRSQAPGGQAFVKLAASRSSRTIARRSAPRFEPPTHRQRFR